MSYLNWKVGDKVVCIETWVRSQDPDIGYKDEQGPVAGQIYTIRELGYFHPRHPESLQLRLCEIDNGKRRYRDAPVPWEQCFAARRFRPVQPRKTSIEVFTRILSNPHVRIREDA